MSLWLGGLLFAALLITAGIIFAVLRSRSRPAGDENSLAQDRERIEELLATACEVLADHSNELRLFERTLDNHSEENPDNEAFENGVEQVRRANRQVEEGMESTVAAIESDFGHILQAEREQMAAYCEKTDNFNSSLDVGEASNDSALAVLAGQLVDMVRELRDDNRSLRAEVKTARETTIELLERTRAAEESARLDSLTKLPNRRAFDEELAKCEASLEDGLTFSVIFMDVDHFKLVNDRYGHAAGDAVLSMVGRVFRDQRRTSDLVSRLGGEEFGVLLPKCPEGPARAVAEQYRKRIESSTLRYHGCEITVTASCGVAEATVGEDIGRLLERADAALYSAKEQGRNRVCVDRQGKKDVEEKTLHEVSC